VIVLRNIDVSYNSKSLKYPSKFFWSLNHDKQTNQQKFQKVSLKSTNLIHQKKQWAKFQTPAITRNVPNQEASTILVLASPIPTTTTSTASPWWASSSPSMSSPWRTVVCWTISPHYITYQFKNIIIYVNLTHKLNLFNKSKKDFSPHCMIFPS